MMEKEIADRSDMIVAGYAFEGRFVQTAAGINTGR